jgi:DNA-binding transcriptional LysR family regulator
MGVIVQLSERIRHRIKLQDLNVLMTVVQAGSMGKAARRLNTSQPAISRAITELEHTLGVRLLDRHGRGVEPTEYGRMFLECGAAVFDDLRQGVKNMAMLADPTAGEVRIGTVAACAGSFVSIVIDRLSRRHPRFVFHMLITNTEGLQRELTERNVDLLISPRFDLFTDRKFDFEFLYDAAYVVVAGAENPWARRRRLALADLVNEPWALPPPDTPVGSLAMNVFHASGIDAPRAKVFVLSPVERMRLLKSGRFLTIVSTAVLGFPVKRPEFKVLPIALSIAHPPIGVVTLGRRTLTAAAQRFIQSAREMAQPLAKRKIS